MNKNGLLNPFDINIKSCKIVTATIQSFELKDIVVEFNYFEDLFNNAITGNILISDSMGFLSNLHFQGYDFLIMELDKPGFDNPIQHTFRISNVSYRNRVHGTNENYRLNFHSEEWLLNEQYLVSKSYKKVLISDIVTDICLNTLGIPKNKLFVDATIGLRDIVIPNIKPFQALNWLCTMALSSGEKSVGAPFFFYENKDEFHFKSILNLFRQDVYRTYRYDEKNIKLDGGYSDIGKDIVNVMKYEHIRNFDSLTAIKKGMYANETITVDPLRLKFGRTKFDYASYSKDAPSLGEYSLPTSGTNRFGDKLNEIPGSVKFVVSNTGQSESVYIKDKQVTVHENRIEETLSNRTAQIMIFTANRMKLMIPGDFHLTVGKLIEFNLPETVYNNTSKTKELDKFYSGKYLVTAVRHIYDRYGKFVTVLEICKDAVNNQYAEFDNTSPAWKGVK